MPNVATLTVSITGNSARLQREFRKANRSAKDFSSRIRKNLAVAGRALGRVGIAAAAGLGVMAAAGTRTADTLAKTAAKLGETTEGLAGLRFAAEQTGNSSRNLDLGLQRMTRRIAEAAQGSGEAKAALQELGLDAQRLTQLRPSQAFAEVAEAMKLVTSQSDRVRLGFKLFDSEGVGLVNTLAVGREGLAAFTEEAKALGLALAPQQLAGIQEAADAGNRMRTAFSGLSQQLASALAPALINSANAITKIIQRAIELLPRIQGLASAFFGLRKEVAALSRAELEAERLALLEKILRVQQQIAGVQRRGRFDTEGDRRLIERYRGELDELNGRLGSVNEQLVTLKNSTEEIDAAGTNASGGLGGLKKDFIDFTQLLPPVNKEMARLTELLEFRDAIANRTNPSRQVVEDIVRLRDVLKAGLITREEFQNQRKILLESVVGPLEEIEGKAKDAFENVREFAVQAARNIQSTFADFLFDPFEEGLDGMLRKFAETLRRMVAEILANKLLTEFLSALARQNNFIGRTVSGFLEGRAAGGPIAAGRPYLVGEKGPEIIASRTAAHVIPNSALGGGRTTVNIINNAGAQVQTRRRRDGAGGELVEILLDQVEARIQGGRMDRSFRFRYGLQPALGSRS